MAEKKKQKNPETWAEMQKPCRGCIYQEANCCCYFEIVGHRRPCKPGKDCTVKRTGRGRYKLNGGK